MKVEAGCLKWKRGLMRNNQIKFVWPNWTNILLQPFGVNFTNVSVDCYLLETGTACNLYIEDTCPSSNSTSVQSFLKAAPWLQGDVINASFTLAVACNPELPPLAGD